MSRTTLSVTTLLLFLIVPVAAVSKGVRSAQLSSSLPLRFEPNRGQAERDVDYVARGKAYSVSLKSAEAVVTLGEPKSSKPEALHLKMLGARRKTTATAAAQLPGRSNYIFGRNPAGWIQNVPQFARVEYADVYPGVDLVYYGNQRQLEYDFLVNPNADAGRITMHFDGARKLSLDADGNLIVGLASGELVQKRPLAYQIINGKPVDVKVRYRIAHSRDISFDIPQYDRTTQLVIDPLLVYSTYLGGSADDLGRAVAADLHGNVYVAGDTVSTDFPIVNAVQPNKSNPVEAAKYDAFVTKIDRDGSALLFSTYLGGSLNDIAYAAAVDLFGNIYVAGTTQSPDFPVLNAYQDHKAGPVLFGGSYYDAFVAKLSSTGTLQYSTYLGGFDYDFATSIAVDIFNNAYVTGFTASPDFPGTSGVSYPNSGAFVAKLDASGNTLAYSFLLQGNGGFIPIPYVQVDLFGNAYVALSPAPLNLPTTAGAEKATGDPDGDVYVAKINQAGDGLVWSTYLGGSDGEQNANLAINFAGDVYVTGATRSADFPLRGSPFQTANYTSDGYDGFLSIFNRTGQLVYSSYFGGIGSEYPTGIGLDVLGNIYISGFANFSGLPSVNAIQPAYGGGNSDGFIVKFNPTANSLLFSTYFGGSADDLISGISVLPLGTVYVAGWTQSGDFPVRNAIQPHLAGQCVTNGCVQYHDAFVAKIADSAGGASDTNLLISLRTGHIQTYNAAGGFTREISGMDDGAAKGMAFDHAGNLFVAHWNGSSALTGNNVEVYDSSLTFRHLFANGLNCNPTSVVFDDAGNLFVGLADCNGDVLKFNPGGRLMATYHVAAENHGAEWLDLAADNCTLFYGSEGPHVKRFNVCTGAQLPDLNPIPVSSIFQVKVLPDTTVLAATPDRVLRFNAAGTIMQQYAVPGETCFRGLGLDSTGTAFFATNYCNSHVYKFDLATGGTLIAFTANSPEFTVKTVAVQPGTSEGTSSRCWFTGGGNLPGLTGVDLTMLTNVTHGFQIHCDAGDLPNNIEVNWDSGNHFHLESLISVTCTDSPGIVPESPAAPCDTITGSGTGSYNGTAGATIQFTFTDAGERGVNDRAVIRIIDASGNVVLETNSTLTGGNQQAHGS